MFNKCEIAEYLILNAKAYINNNKRITYRDIYAKFDDPDKRLWRHIEEVGNYITNRDTHDCNGDNLRVQYTVMFRNKFGFPGDGFFDEFRTINRSTYNKITKKTNTLNLSENEKQNIVDISSKVLAIEINSKFADEDQIRAFLTKMENAGKC